MSRKSAPKTAPKTDPETFEDVPTEAVPPETILAEPGVPILPERDDAPAGDGESAAPPSDPLDHDGDGRPGGSIALQHALVITADHEDLRATEVVWASAARAAELRAAGVARDATPAQVELAQPRVRVLA